jgi:ribosomal protein S18 acetylase RimI-like enzyme
MEIIIRDADPKDIDKMLPLLKQLFAIETDFNFDQNVQARGLKMMLDGCGKHRAVKVALSGKKIIGMCTAQTRISTAQGKISAVVEDLVVDKNSQGQGIGPRLLDAVENWAIKKGITAISLLADKDNHKGLEFYRARNWEPTALVCLVKSL